MGLFSSYLLRRLLGAPPRHHRRPPRHRSPYGHGWGTPSRRHHQARGRFGLFGPMPYYSRRTRRGGTVGVSGCCLPIPIGFGMLVLGTGRLLARLR